MTITKEQVRIGLAGLVVVGAIYGLTVLGDRYIDRTVDTKVKSYFAEHKGEFKGAKGDKGATGAVGKAGATGARGYTGSAGQNGSDGQAGSDGCTWLGWSNSYPCYDLGFSC